jgi:putative DNA primase/helicase
MPNSNQHTTNNQYSDTIYVALHQTALAIAEKLKTQRLLDTTRRPNPDHTALYYNNTRNLVAASLRWNTTSGKIVRPVRRVGSENKFELGAPPTWPLYNLPSLLDADPAKPVVVVEGEPCVDYGDRIFGDLAIFITSAQGANNAHKSDWSPVRGREIYVWPDADDAGKQYAKTVAELASKAGAKLIKILDPVAIAGR